MCRNKRSVVGVFIKAMVSIFFILTAMVGTLAKIPDEKNVEFGIFIIAGLIFGLLGDIFLDQKWVYPDDMAKYLYSGFIVFGIGHIFYTSALFRAANLSLQDLIIPVIAGIVVAVGNVVLEKPLKIKFGKFRAIVMIYAVFLTGTLATAAIIALRTGEISYIVFTGGALLFLISDLILSPMYFGEGKNTPLNFVLNHVTYYVGQYLIALSVFLMK